MRKETRSLLILLLTAMIWGMAFAAQRIGSEFVPPITFGAARYSLGAAVMALILYIRRIRQGSPALPDKKTFMSGVLLGIILTCASLLQQVGIQLTGAGHAGFLTSLYVVLVPVFGSIIFRTRTQKGVILSLLLTVPALYLLCGDRNGVSLSVGDSAVILCAVFWAMHILVTDKLAANADPLTLCFVQFATSGALCLPLALIFEGGGFASVGQAIVPILYIGIFSTAAGYTLQTIGQRSAPPAHAALVLSMESVFSVLGGVLLLGERLSLRSFFGCALMLTAVIISQISTSRREN